MFFIRLFLVNTSKKIRGHLARLRKKRIYFAIEFSLREISYILYVHAPMSARYDVEIVRSRDAQCNTKELP